MSHMKLYIDCTETYKTKLNTGIQRVVKKIAQLSVCTPVYFDGIGFLPIDSQSLNPGKVQLVKHSRNLIVNIPLLYPLAKSAFKSCLVLKTYLTFFKNKPRYIKFKEGDVLLSADIVRGKHLVNKLQKLKIPIYQIIYDLLPLKYPQYFGGQAVEEFKRISSLWPTYAKKLFAISKKVAQELDQDLGVKSVDFFYLGSDFTEKNFSPILTKFEDFYLVVGTIEPRKNHIHILETFLKLWKEGSQEKLVFIGRKGWHFKDILKYINEAQIFFPDHFLWLDDLDDHGLESYYQNSKAVICASIDEGFGLPIIEALSRKKNVLCSDIQVFREIGTNYCTYFNFELDGQDSLLEIIKCENYKIDISDFKWLTWQESVDRLIDKIIKDQK